MYPASSIDISENTLLDSLSRGYYQKDLGTRLTHHAKSSVSEEEEEGEHIRGLTNRNNRGSRSVVSMYGND